jgi:hypothetical protein
MGCLSPTVALLKERIMAENIGLVIVLIALGAWFTHVIACLAASSWGFLIAGALFFPVAVVHGVGIWLGVW